MAALGCKMAALRYKMVVSTVYSLLSHSHPKGEEEPALQCMCTCVRAHTHTHTHSPTHPAEAWALHWWSPRPVLPRTLPDLQETPQSYYLCEEQELQRWLQQLLNDSMFIAPVNSHDSPDTPLSLFYSCGNWGSEMPINFLKVPIVSEGARNSVSLAPDCSMSLAVGHKQRFSIIWAQWPWGMAGRSPRTGQTQAALRIHQGVCGRPLFPRATFPQWLGSAARCFHPWPSPQCQNETALLLLSTQPKLL